MLNSAKVPKNFEPLFEKAEEYVSKYFQSRIGDPSTGTIEVCGERYILIRASSLSVDFFSMIMELYKNDHPDDAAKFARQILFDFSHSIGRQDAKAFHAKMNLTDPLEKLSVGPIHFSHTGWAFVDIFPESNPSPDENFFLAYDHIYSFEAEAWQKAGKKSDFCVCVMNAGYSSGWCEESFGIPLVASEILCKAKGDEACRFVMAHTSTIQSHITEEISHYKPDQKVTTSISEIPVFWKWKQQEDSLRESEKKFRGAFEFSAMGLALVALDNTCIQANQALCKITGYSEAELTTKKLSDITHPDDIATNSENLKRLLEENTPYYHLEMRLIHKQNSVAWVGLSASLVRDSKDKPLYFVVQAEDINQRKEAEEGLKNTQNQLIVTQKLAGIGQLAAGVCHEVLNPLNILSMHAQLLSKGRKEDIALQATVEKMRNEIKRIQKIIGTLSTFSQRKSTEVKKFQLSFELESVLLLFEKDFQLNNIVIVKDFNSELPDLWFDPDQLRQVLINLINNAKYAMKDGGVLSVSAKKCIKGGFPFVKLNFSDTGIGIEKEKLDKIFDPFYSTKPEGEGTGMGLSIVHSIIEKHGGTIQVESIECQGTTFTIDFPIKNSL